MKSISVIIPNYNGKKLLEKNLPFLLKELKKYKSSEVIVVDDASTDGSVKFLKEKFPEVKVVVNKENRGFSYSCNAGARVSKGEIIYFLNSDCRVKENFLNFIIPHFKDEDVFAVGSSEENNYTYPDVKFKYGILYYKYRDIEREKAFNVFFVSGGHSAFDRNKFLALGGFDEFLSPFYGEDIDLCWRAKKMGWKIILEPGSKVYHQGQVTISKYHNLFMRKTILWRNRFLIMWKNFSKKELLNHFLFLPALFLLSPLKDVYLFFGFLKAVYKEIYG